MWGVLVAFATQSDHSRSWLESYTVKGDSPVGIVRNGVVLQTEYLALAVAKEDGGKRPPRLNTFQDR